MAQVPRLTLLLPARFLAAGASFGTPSSGITLRLRETTLAETAAAVSRASGTSVQVSPGVVAPGLPGAAVRAGFAWENASLDRVLREVCARFQCRCGQDGAGYALYPAAPF